MCPLSCYQSANSAMVTNDRNWTAGPTVMCPSVYVLLNISNYGTNYQLRLITKFNERFLKSA